MTGPVTGEVTDRELDTLAADLAAVVAPGPVTGEFGPVLYGEVRPAPGEVVRRMAANGLVDPES